MLAPFAHDIRLEWYHELWLLVIVAFLDVWSVLPVDYPTSVAFHGLCVKVTDRCVYLSAWLSPRLRSPLLHCIYSLADLRVLLDSISKVAASWVRHISPVRWIHSESLLPLSISNGYSLTIVLPSPIVS